jgi:hypothetical protein
LSIYRPFRRLSEGALVQEVPLDEGAVQNITNTISLTKEWMSESYSSINTFSQLLMVVFQNYECSIDDTYKEFNYYFKILQSGVTSDLDAEF